MEGWMDGCKSEGGKGRRKIVMKNVIIDWGKTRKWQDVEKQRLEEAAEKEWGKKLGEAIFEKLKSRQLEMPQIFEEDKKQKAAGKQHYGTEKLGGELYHESRRRSLNALKM